MSAREEIKRIFGSAGITINGSASFDIQVNNDRFYSVVLGNGSLGLGESYMDGDWDCQNLDLMIAKILEAKIDETPIKNISLVWEALKAKIFNLQIGQRAFEVGEKHYDLGNDLFRGMLDQRMVYTCGYWKEAKNLDEAQEAKLDLVCRKIGLKKDDHVLDIGCGFGSFMKFAFERYGAKSTGVSVSREQIKQGQELNAGLPTKFDLKDYHDIADQYDHIVSIGMFEAVGKKNFRSFFEVARRALKPGGLFLLHTIGRLESKGSGSDPWIEKYIFPNGCLPNLSEIALATEKLFTIEDVHNFSADYYPTLMTWYKNFEAAWPELKQHYSKRFYRMWRYYLLICAGSFLARKNQLYQIVLSPDGVRGGYRAVR